MAFIRVKRFFRETRFNIVTDSLDAANRCWVKALEQRIILESYLTVNPVFRWSLDPVEIDPWAPEVVKRMASAGFLANVGPMASVAGVIADMALEEGLKANPNILVIENGGEVAASALTEPVSIGVYTGVNTLDGFRFVVKPQDTPLGVGSSSSRLGAGVSFGEADLVTVFAENAGLADAAATSVCNIVRAGDSRRLVERALDEALEIQGVRGCLIVYRDLIGLRGWVPEIVRTSEFTSRPG